MYQTKTQQDLLIIENDFPYYQNIHYQEKTNLSTIDKIIHAKKKLPITETNTVVSRNNLPSKQIHYYRKYHINKNDTPIIET